jgi:hypothetical protein
VHSLGDPKGNTTPTVVCVINVSDICVYVDISYPVFLNNDEIKWYPCLSHNGQRREAVECVVRCCQSISVRRCCDSVIRFQHSTCLSYANTCPEISGFYIRRRCGCWTQTHRNRNRLTNCVHHSTSQEAKSRSSSYIIQRVSCNPSLRNSKLTCCYRHKSQGRHQICYSVYISHVMTSYKT